MSSMLMSGDVISVLMHTTSCASLSTVC